MQTIRRKKPKHAPRGDYQALCAYCGTVWYRKAGRMGKDRSGQLSCKDCKDYEGHDAVTLSEGNALASSRPRPRARDLDGANFESRNNLEEAVYLSSGGEIEL